MIAPVTAQQPAWDDALDHEKIEDQLGSRLVHETLSFTDYLYDKGTTTAPSHAVLLVELEGGLKGVFKQGTYAYAEVAGYRASKALGLRLVPPTILREVQGNLGSLQFYVEGYDLAGKNQQKAFRRIDPKSFHDMKVFYYVFGQWDTHGGNQLIASSQGRNYLALVDNSGMLHKLQGRYGGKLYCSKGKNFELPTNTDQTFPYHQIKTIEGDTVPQHLAGYVSARQLNRFSELPSFSYVIWHHRLYVELTNEMHKLFTTTFYRSTLIKLQELTYHDVFSFWVELAEVYPDFVENQVRLTLERRDELLAFAQTQGTIIENALDL